MSVNLLPKYRVIAIIAVVSIAASALAWSGEHRLYPPSVPGSDTTPTQARPAVKAPKQKKVLKEGRTARELDLRMDVDDAEAMPEIPEMDALDELKNMSIEEEDLQTLKELNIDGEIWNELSALKEQMDDLQLALEDDQAKGIYDYKLLREMEAVMDAIQEEMPRVRQEVQKALQEYKDVDGRTWQ
jgi:hypothetical protein